MADTIALVANRAFQSRDFVELMQFITSRDAPRSRSELNALSEADPRLLRFQHMGEDQAVHGIRPRG